MAATKNLTEFEKTKRKAEVTKLRLQGWTQAQIGEKYDITQGAVSQLLATIEEEWRESAAADISLIKAQANAKIELIEQEYWAGFERSLQARETKSIKEVSVNGSKKKNDKDTKSDNDAKTDGKDRSEKSIRHESQVGDPRWLDGARRCNLDRVELFGVAAPKKIDIKDVSGRPTDYLATQLAGLLAKCGPLTTGSDEVECGGADSDESDHRGAGEASGEGEDRRSEVAGEASEQAVQPT